MYLAIEPKTYQARLQLQMAELNNNSIETPEALVQRLSSPGSYSVEVRRSCGVAEGDVADYLDGRLEVRATKKVATAVDIKIKGESVEQVKQCVEAVVGVVVQSQNSLIKERLAGRQEQLIQYQQRVKEEQQKLAEVTNVELSRVVYLARLDTLSWLRIRIDNLQEESFLSTKHPAKLIGSIYIPSKPIAPKPALLMLLGALSGLTLGIAFAFFRDFVYRNSRV